MSLKKRGKTWHTHFFVDGQRFRQSLETSDWREAQSKEKDLIAAAKAGKLSADEAGVCAAFVSRGRGAIPAGPNPATCPVERSDRARAGESAEQEVRRSPGVPHHP